MVNSSLYKGFTMRIITTVAVVLFVYLNAHSQSLTRKQINLFLGSQTVNCDKFMTSSDLDFLNYVDSEGYSGLLGNYMFIGIMYQIEFKDKVEAKVTVGMHSDLAPVKLNFSSSYFFNRTIGFGASFFGYPQNINDFNLHHWNNDVGLIDLNTNTRQRKIYNLGLAIGPDLRFRSSIFSFNIKLHSGVRWLKSFTEGFFQKQINGNYIRATNYITHNSPTFYFFPQVEIEIKLFKIGQTTIGIMGKASREWSYREINYTKNVSEWVNAPYSRTVTFPGHKYIKYDYDVGLNFSW